MAFPTIHTYVTFHWLAPGDEEGQFGLRFSSGVLPSQIELDALHGEVRTLWSGIPALVSGALQLYKLKAALIDVDGKYPTGHVPRESIMSPISGNAAPVQALQVAQVLTLEGPIPRGPAGRGRIYLPAQEEAVGATGVWPAGTIGQRLAFGKGIVDAVNEHLGPVGRVAIYSSKGFGNVQNVTSVRLGNRPDVQRRRAAQLTESYTTAAITV